MSTGCSREAFSLSTKSCWTYRAGVHIGHCRGRQPGHSEKSEPLGRGCEWACSSWSSTLGSSVQRGHGQSRDSLKQEFSATDMFLFLNLSLLTIYLALLYYPSDSITKKKKGM